MQPYYEQDGIVIYHGDCRDVLPTLARDSVDLIVTDPPYGMNWESGQRKQSFGKITGDESTDIALAGIATSLPAMRDKRHVYTFGRFDFSSLPLTDAVELIWDKITLNGGDLSSSWGMQHEYIQFRTLRRAKTERDIVGTGLAARLRRGSVLRYQRPSGGSVTRHPTEKPVDLLRELIESSSRIGETVLDPFVGSGSTLEAAQREGRRAIGIEIEERYCEIAARRLQQSVMPLDLVAD